MYILSWHVSKTQQPEQAKSIFISFYFNFLILIIWASFDVRVLSTYYLAAKNISLCRRSRPSER